MARLAGKVALITGGARGMGAATARRFVDEGAKVAIADLLEADGAALAADLGDGARFYNHDVTDEASWARVTAAVEAELGPLDVLVNNAGILMFKALLDTTREEYERVLQVNLVGMFLGVKAVGAKMVERGSGSIVNISSIEGVRGSNGIGAYASSKWGVRGLTRSAAMELGHRGVRVNSVHPGAIDTMMSNPSGAERAALNGLFTLLPAQRMAGPEEVANATLFLASDEASYVYGAELLVDGGYTTGVYTAGLPGAPGA